MLSAFSDHLSIRRAESAPRPSGPSAAAVTTAASTATVAVARNGPRRLLPNTVNGLAFINANGISQHVGDNLPTSLRGQEAAASVVAHEIGHNLGLFHTDPLIPLNLMQPGGAPMQGEQLNATQIATALASNFSVPIPEASTLPILAAILLWMPLADRRRRAAKA